MTTPRIDELLLMMDCAFEESEHSLLTNLASVPEETWEALPAGGKRPIRQLVHHVGMFKFMYANHGFRGADFDYGKPPATPARERLVTKAAAVDWLREGHAYLTGCARELADDAELDVPRKAHWGGMVPTRHLIVTMIEHDVYHAGEINHARALLQNDDGWFVPKPTLYTDG